MKEIKEIIKASELIKQSGETALSIISEINAVLCNRQGGFFER